MPSVGVGRIDILVKSINAKESAQPPSLTGFEQGFVRAALNIIQKCTAKEDPALNALLMLNGRGQIVPFRTEFYHASNNRKRVNAFWHSDRNFLYFSPKDAATDTFQVVYAMYVQGLYIAQDKPMFRSSEIQVGFRGEIKDEALGETSFLGAFDTAFSAHVENTSPTYLTLSMKAIGMKVSVSPAMEVAWDSMRVIPTERIEILARRIKQKEHPDQYILNDFDRDFIGSAIRTIKSKVGANDTAYVKLSLLEKAGKIVPLTDVLYQAPNSDQVVNAFWHSDMGYLFYSPNAVAKNTLNLVSAIYSQGIYAADNSPMLGGITIEISYSGTLINERLTREQLRRRQDFERTL